MVIAVSSLLAYHGVLKSLESSFATGLGRMARTLAEQVPPSQVADLRLRGEDSEFYGDLTLLLALRSATGAENAALIDSEAVTLVDAREGRGAEHLPSDLDSLARPALRRSLAGAATLSAPYRRGERVLRAAFAPIREPGRPVAGTLAVEAEVAYLPVLADLARTLTLITVVTALAISVLAVLILRAALSATRLERRLSRVENLAAMGRLTATLAHEIKNPLAIIRGSVDRLGRLEPEAQRMSSFVVEEVDRLGRTVERYLQFARGDAEIHETGDAIAALNATLDLLEGELKARGIEVVRSGKAPESAPVGLDNESLKQVYLNLILNALDAQPEGGRLEIHATERPGWIEVSLTDRGPGIPDDVLKKMGSAFYTTKAKGSGLGLFLTRRLVQAGGGDLEIRSEVGRGTTCVVRLPRVKG